MEPGGVSAGADPCHLPYVWDEGIVALRTVLSQLPAGQSAGSFFARAWRSAACLAVTPLLRDPLPARQGVQERHDGLDICRVPLSGLPFHDCIHCDAHLVGYRGDSPTLGLQDRDASLDVVHGQSREQPDFCLILYQQRPGVNPATSPVGSGIGGGENDANATTTDL